MNLDMGFDLQDQIQSQSTGYRISYRNYVSTSTKMASDDRYPPGSTYTTITFDLTFDLQCQIQGQRRDTGYSPEIPTTCVPKLCHTTDSLPGQLAQP